MCVALEYKGVVVLCDKGWKRLLLTFEDVPTQLVPIHLIFRWFVTACRTTPTDYQELAIDKRSIRSNYRVLTTSAPFAKPRLCLVGRYTVHHLRKAGAV